MMDPIENWHWEWCPACLHTGEIIYMYPRPGGPPGNQVRVCGSCGGLGRLRVPNGYRLEAEPVYTSVTTSGTSAAPIRHSLVDG